MVSRRPRGHLRASSTDASHDAGHGALAAAAAAHAAADRVPAGDLAAAVQTVRLLRSPDQRVVASRGGRKVLQ